MSGEPVSFLGGRVVLHLGDCFEALRSMPADSLDACVTDPPYHLTSIVKRFGAENAAPAKTGKTGAFARASRGFMGKTWDGGDIAFRVDLWREVCRVLKPGAHLLAFSGTRTYHRMACAIEDAGFEIRDMTAWLYGAGFPKSLDVSKAIDKAAGVERTEVLGKSARHGGGVVYAPATEAAKQWEGWGTALKPALEPICLARKPLVGTVAKNVLTHGTGALNIDACRVEGSKPLRENSDGGEGMFGLGSRTAAGSSNEGRWPANVIHDGSPEVLAAFPQTKSGEFLPHHNAKGKNQIGTFDIRDRTGETHPTYGDAGSAARFFYSAKADSDDRLGSGHPTVKPVDLMQYLLRLVTPKGGVVLDCFAGTGTTGEAAWREGFNAVLIEREAEYQADISRRMALCLAGPEERARASVKAALQRKGAVENHGPLFDMPDAAE